jgi:hypothetical protein
MYPNNRDRPHYTLRTLEHGKAGGYLRLTLDEQVTSCDLTKTMVYFIQTMVAACTEDEAKGRPDAEIGWRSGDQIGRNMARRAEEAVPKSAAAIARILQRLKQALRDACQDNGFAGLDLQDIVEVKKGNGHRRLAVRVHIVDERDSE